MTSDTMRKRWDTVALVALSHLVKIRYSLEDNSLSDQAKFFVSDLVEIQRVVSQPIAQRLDGPIDLFLEIARGNGSPQLLDAKFAAALSALRRIANLPIEEVTP